MHTNQQMVKAWLKVNERNQMYLARHTGLTAALINLFMRGKFVSNKTLAKIAALTKLPLEIRCKSCGKRRARKR
jgi:hypothetical protein